MSSTCDTTPSRFATSADSAVRRWASSPPRVLNIAGEDDRRRQPERRVGVRTHAPAVCLVLGGERDRDVRRLVELGQLDVARIHARKTLEAHPDFSLEQWQKMMPDKYAEDSMAFAEGLRKAGLT